MMPLRHFVIRVLALAGKEALHVRRDPRTIVMALVMPVVMILLFGFGVNFDLDRLPLAAVDQDRTEESRALVRAVTASREFDLLETPASPEAAPGLFRRGEVLAVLVVPPRFGERVRSDGRAEVQLLLDGSDSTTAQQALVKAEALVSATGAHLSASTLPRPEWAAGPPLGASTWILFNPAARSALFLVPGLAAYVLAMVAVLLTALTVSREWERGSMEQLFATPVGRLEIILGKLLPYLVLGAASVLLVLAAGQWVFDVPVRGSLSALAVTSLLFLLGMLGQGLFISVLARNQMVATQVGAMTSMIPTLLLSGLIFPIENMPRVLQWLSVAMPARYYVAALRGILLRGNGFAELWREALSLAAFDAVVIAAAVARFRRRLG